MHDEGRGRGTGGWIRLALWAGVAGLVLFVALRGLTSIRLLPADEAPSAPALELMGLDGRPWHLSDHLGEVVLLNLWAGWCPPCRAEVPRLNRLQERLGPRGLVVLGVNVEPDGPAAIRQSAERLGIRYRVARPRGAWPECLGWDGSLPTLWAIDRRGRVRARHVGLVGERALGDAFDRLVSESP